MGGSSPKCFFWVLSKRIVVVCNLMHYIISHDKNETAHVLLFLES